MSLYMNLLPVTCKGSFVFHFILPAFLSPLCFLCGSDWFPPEQYFCLSPKYPFDSWTEYLMRKLKYSHIVINQTRLFNKKQKKTLPKKHTLKFINVYMTLPHVTLILKLNSIFIFIVYMMMMMNEF